MELTPNQATDGLYALSSYQPQLPRSFNLHFTGIEALVSATLFDHYIRFAECLSNFGLPLILFLI